MGHPNTSSKLPAVLRETLRHPVRLRVVLAGLLLAAWYLAGFRPLAARIATAEVRLAEDRERLALARDLASLADDEDRYRSRLLAGGDRNAWARFLMGGIQGRPVRLVGLDPQPAALAVGPYRAEAARVVVEGPYDGLESFLRWLETSPRLVRVDKIEIGPSKNALQGGPPEAAGLADYELTLLVLGVVN